MLKKRLLLGLVALAALVLTASDASVRAQRSDRPELTEEFHQTYPLAAGGRVSLENINGSVRITAWDRSEVKVDAVKWAYTRERLNEAQVEVNASAGSIYIKTEYPDADQTFTNDRHGRR